MTEAETIAGTTHSGTKPGSTDENPGAPDMDRGHRTQVPGVQPQPDFGATDPAASSVAPASTENGRSSDPFAPTPADAAPVKTAELSSSGSDKTAQQDKDSDQARKDEAGNQPRAKDARTDGPSFGDIKADAKTQQDARNQGAMGARIGSSPDLHGVGYLEPEPTIGRIVLYSLTQADADRINTRRVYGPKGDDGTALEEGGSVQAGVVYPAIITGVGDQVVNLHVFADGNHGVWLEHVKRGTDGGTWAWPKVTR